VLDLILFSIAVPLVAISAIVFPTLGFLATPFDRDGSIYIGFMRIWARIVLFLLRIRFRVYGTENIVHGKPYIYIINHASWLDVPLLTAAIPDELLFLYKRELRTVPVWGWGLHFSPHIEVQRTDPRNAMAGIEEAARLIRERRKSVAIFPEGTRSTTGELLEFKRGGFLLAAKTGVPLVPIAIRGSAKHLPKGGFRVTPGLVEIVIGTPIPNPGNLSRVQEKELLAVTRARLIEMLA
jgi:1-acyl-sn-glycerol-3-phosphate acyltransferase